MAWRDTLFVWRGNLKVHEDSTKFIWKGTWVGVDSADSRSAATPSESSFCSSKMTFEVGGSLIRKQSPTAGASTETWSGCELKFDKSYPGWLLDNGDGPQLFQDADHTILFAEGLVTLDEGFPVFAAGTNDFAPFISVGRCVRRASEDAIEGRKEHDGDGLQLTLARRYLAEKDERVKWRPDQVRDAVLGGADSSFRGATGAESGGSDEQKAPGAGATSAVESNDAAIKGGACKARHVDTTRAAIKACVAPWGSSGPWRCGTTLHAASKSGAGSKRKRRNTKSAEDAEAGTAPLPLCMHNDADWALKIDTRTTDESQSAAARDAGVNGSVLADGTHLAVALPNVDYEDQCWGCGGPVHSLLCKRSQCAAGCSACSECTCGVRQLVLVQIHHTDTHVRGSEVLTAELCGGEKGKACIQRALPELARFSSHWKSLHPKTTLGSPLNSLEDDFWDAVVASPTLLEVVKGAGWSEVDWGCVDWAVL